MADPHRLGSAAVAAISGCTPGRVCRGSSAGADTDRASQGTRRALAKGKLVGLILGYAATACGGDGTEADRIGVGAECSSNADCAETAGEQLTCLQFKGGYCGLLGCAADDDCPEGSRCVSHDGQNYCFRSCLDKAECNRNRHPDNAANCSANVTFVTGKESLKACVPPSG